MPIGKNSIKRVANNGYSKVASSSPDMENSEIVTKKAKSESTKATKPAAKTTATKPAAKTAAATKKAETKPAPVAKKPAPTQKKPTQSKKAAEVKPTTVEKPETTSYINVGGTLPIYLL